MQSISKLPHDRKKDNGVVSSCHWLPGATGGSYRGCWQGQCVVSRYIPAKPLPLVDRKREYRLLTKVAKGGFVDKPLAIQPHRLILPWQPGQQLEPQLFEPNNSALMALLKQLHQLPLSGYPLNLSVLLQQYWLCCEQKTHRWLQALKKLTRQGQPPPLRIALLHMDIHPGNLIIHQDALKLIDWEYAGDGDIALEIAAIGSQMPGQQLQLIEQYATLMRLDCDALYRQVRRWQPWLRLLSASWYQLRAEQTAQAHFQQLAAASWQLI